MSQKVGEKFANALSLLANFQSPSFPGEIKRDFCFCMSSADGILSFARGIVLMQISGHILVRMLV